MFFDKEIIKKNVTYIAIEIKTKYCFADRRVCNYVNRVPKIKQVEEFQLIPRKKCCAGYEEIAKDECVPKCNNCENGKCIYTDFCVCNTGYRRNYALNKCVSRCDVDCINGICIGNNECKCDEGYKLSNNSDIECIPDCKSGNQCLNGDCIGPDKCNCHDGYTKNSTTNICEPICYEPCINGICTDLNECTCNYGYELKNNSSNICEPVCSNGCTNGKCVDVEKCQCDDGYNEVIEEIEQYNNNYETTSKNNYRKICEPICKNECINGICTKPNQCTCNLGYKHIKENHKIDDNNLTNICIPICDNQCINGNCIAPNLCECHNGYRNHPSNVTICEPICNDNCHKNGYCAEPNKCACKKGFLERNNKCLSECELLCKNGLCNNEHNECKCFNGYKQNTTLQCLPICEPDCGNGICYKPNQCSCHHGYEFNKILKKCMTPCPDNAICGKHTDSELLITDCIKGYKLNINKTKCEPICDKNCINGKCIGPNICECIPGYDNTNENLYICEPICEPLCENGKCIKPNICECLPGYENNNTTSSNINICTPICPNTNCTNGYCIRLNECKCLDGYKLSNQNHMICEPICNNPICNLDISKCIAPNVCDCLEGYELTIMNNQNQSNDDTINSTTISDLRNSSCIPICDKINCTYGVCISPNKCDCFNGYKFNKNEQMCETNLLNTLNIAEVSAESNTVGKRKSGSLLTGILVTCGVGFCLLLLLFVGLFIRRKLRFQQQLNITASNFNLMNPIYDNEQ